MRKICYIALALLAAVLTALAAISAVPLRLHILADSDAPEAQAVKLKVRDAILREAGEDLSAAATEAQAEELAERSLARLTEIANRVLRENGMPYSARAELGTFSFSERVYRGRVYPAGDYRALRIVLGSGEGHNWWCVLFPPLCATELGTGQKIAYRSYLADWLKGVLHA